MAQSSNDETIRALLLGKIDGNERGKHWTKVKVLMGYFGYAAASRVRQTSINEVLRSLDEWGLAYEYDGLGANDYITLSRATAATPAKKAATSIPPPPVGAPWSASINPLQFAFRVGSDRNEPRSLANADDVLAAIWCFRPVCLMLSGDDEAFAFLGGLLSAQMRRRALMVRTPLGQDRSPTGPEILSLARLKHLVGRSDEAGERSAFPAFGGVYVVRDDAKDTRDDELVALVRELFVPHTYRVDARFGVVEGPNAEQIEQPRASASEGFPKLLEWLCALAGGRALASQLPPNDTLDLASLLADAARLQDVLLDRATLLKLDPDFCAGFESTEHMALKNVLLRHLRDRHPGEKVLVERRTDIPDEEKLYDDQTGDEGERRRACRPDLWIPKKLWVEVETLRGISIRGSSPFFDLEQKMRARLGEIGRDGGEVWLVVPSDVAALATKPMAALVRNLAASGMRIRWGFVDLETRAPVFVETTEVEPPAPSIDGVSWRDRAKPAAAQKLTWNDVAGYTDFRDRLKSDVLRPLVERKRFEQFDLGPANGLLLFGLPGCGKSLAGRVLAGEADLTCRLIVPSDLTSMWLGEGVAKIRELFDWALKQRSCLIVIDEIDAVAPQRQEQNMHTDEKRQVNELLAQLDRITGKPVMVVATTNYLRGIDGAIRRSGRFDVKIPVYPPTEADRRAIFEHYAKRLKNIDVRVDSASLARDTPLFTPADIKAVVQGAARRAVCSTEGSATPAVTTEDLARLVQKHPRAIQKPIAEEWIAEARLELGGVEKEQLDWLQEEVKRAYGA